MNLIKIETLLLQEMENEKAALQELAYAILEQQSQPILEVNVNVKEPQANKVGLPLR